MEKEIRKEIKDFIRTHRFELNESGFNFSAKDIENTAKNMDAANLKSLAEGTASLNLSKDNIDSHLESWEFKSLREKGRLNTLLIILTLIMYSYRIQYQ